MAPVQCCAVIGACPRLRCHLWRCACRWAAAGVGLLAVHAQQPALTGDQAAPVPLLHAGSVVCVTKKWEVHEGKEVALEAVTQKPDWTRCDIPPDAPAMLESAPVVKLETAHIYRVEFPLQLPLNVSTAVRVRFGTSPSAEQLLWPQWHGGPGLNPRGDRIGGYIIVARTMLGTAVCRLRLTCREKLPATVHIGPITWTDFGRVPAGPGFAMYQNGFEHWRESGEPHDFSVVFAKPQQLSPTPEAAHSGQHGAANNGGRALCFGPPVPCRFGSILRLRISARGRGAVTLAVIPYLGRTGRGIAPNRTRLEATRDWREYTALTVQNQPKADHVVPTIELNGKLLIDDFRVERVAVPEQTK